MTPSSEGSTVVRHALASHASSGTQHEADVMAKLLGWTALGFFFLSLTALLVLLD